MSQHSEVGNIALPVGTYTKGSETKKRYRNIGVLMRTVDKDGERFWIKLNADIFHASLFSIASIVRARGEDTFIANVFEPREKQAGAPAEQPAEDGPF